MSRTTAREMTGSNKSEKDLPRTAEGAGGSGTKTTSFPPGNEDGTERDESVEPVVIFEKSSADGETENEEDSTQTKETEGKKNHSLLKNTIGFAILVAIIGVSIYFASSLQNTNIGVDIDKNWEEGLQNLQDSLTGQTSRFWKKLRNRGRAHLRNKHPKQPLVFLLAAVPRAHGIVDCLATKLAELLDPPKKNNLTKIVGRDLQNTQGHVTKKMMDEILFEAFRTGSKVALINHLHLLPPRSPILFHSYCDDQNAPYKHAALIFTVHLPREPDASLTPVEAEGTVENYLAQEVWANSPYNKDEIAALLSRIADTVHVLLVYSPDKSSSVDSYCED